MMIIVDPGCGCPCCQGEMYTTMYNNLVEYIILLAIIVIREREGLD